MRAQQMKTGKNSTFVLDTNKRKIEIEGSETKDILRCHRGKTGWRLEAGHDIQYKLAVCLTGKDAKITLIDFQCIQQE